CAIEPFQGAQISLACQRWVVMLFVSRDNPQGRELCSGGLEMLEYIIQIIFKDVIARNCPPNGLNTLVCKQITVCRDDDVTFLAFSCDLQFRLSPQEILVYALEEGFSGSLLPFDPHFELPDELGRLSQSFRAQLLSFAGFPIEIKDEACFTSNPEILRSRMVWAVSRKCEV
ncbi:hypothetical protein BX616_002273, partial [Lobosporangium transversale]